MPLFGHLGASKGWGHFTVYSIFVFFSFFFSFVIFFLLVTVTLLQPCILSQSLYNHCHPAPHSFRVQQIPQILQCLSC